MESVRAKSINPLSVMGRLAMEPVAESFPISRVPPFWVMVTGPVPVAEPDVLSAISVPLAIVVPPE